MKTRILILCLLSACSAYAQSTADSTDLYRESSVSELFGIGEKTYDKAARGTTSFRGHWNGVRLGFMNFAKLAPETEAADLNMNHSLSMQFNLVKREISLSKKQNFGIVTGLGLEYQRFRFQDNNITFHKTDGQTLPTEVRTLHTDAREIRKSSFKNLYLTIPVLLEVQIPKNTAPAKRMFLSAGVMAGIRMHSKTKIVYQDNQNDTMKKKQKGNFNVLPVKADAVVQIGYRHVTLWGSYTLTRLFKKSSLPDLNVYTVGFGFSI